MFQIEKQRRLPGADRRAGLGCCPELGIGPVGLRHARGHADRWRSIRSLYGIPMHCEGDVRTYDRTQARQWEAITEHAFFSWKNGQAHGPADLPEAAAELPTRYRIPFSVSGHF